VPPGPPEPPVEIPVVPTATESTASRLERLEHEYRNLLTRMERLEKQKGAWLPGLLGGVLLVLAVGALLDYLGVFPHPVERLPLAAKSVETNEFTLTGPDGKPRLKLKVKDNEVTRTRYDAHGTPLPEEPLFPQR
jgi:hypothetical protein